MSTTTKGTPPTPGKPAWHKRINESAKAHAAFKAYCELGPSRSLRALGQKLGKSVALYEQWSARFEWVARVAAWDEHQEEIDRKAKEAAMKAEAEKWARRQAAVRENDWALAEALRKKAEAMLDYPIAKKTTTDGGATVHIHPQKFSLGSAARMIEVASKLARLASGAPTEHLEHTGPDNAPLPGASIGQVVILELPDNGRDKTTMKDPNDE
jgi:hypothetical protein